LCTFLFAALPFAALATLNSGMASIFSQLIVIAGGFSIWEFLQTNTAHLNGVEWVRDSIALIALMAVAIPIVVIQYKSRRTPFSRYYALSGVAVSGLVFVAMPWPLALAVQSHLSEEPSIASSMRVALGTGQRFWLAQLRPKAALHIPIVVDGIPAGTELQVDAFKISLNSPDGRAETLGVLDCSDLKRSSGAARTATVSAVCSTDPSFFEREPKQLLTLHGSLYFTLFGNPRSATIPLTDEPTNAIDGLQCYTQERAEWDVYCRSAFRWPSRLIYATLGHTNAHSFTQFVSYSPFPASLNIDPVETRWASAYAAGPPPVVRDVTIVVQEPVAHVRRDFEAREIQLTDLAVPTVLGVPPQNTAIP
jgi:hypothetical protein